MNNNIKHVIAEWVLTNGKLPGFEERLKESLPNWKVVGPEGMMVYRAQGNTFVSKSEESPSPEILLTGIRPVIATSKTPESTKRYAGIDCCIFKIRLEPGVRYIDVNETITFLNEDGDAALAVKNDILDKVRKLCSPQYFPSPTTPLIVLRKTILDRCLGRIKFFGKPNQEEIPAENEIMVYGGDGVFKNQKEIDEKIYEKRTFEITYGPLKGSSRGRTFRRSSKRRNKNGYRFTRKSKHCIGHSCA
jgi:hypothetical protein